MVDRHDINIAYEKITESEFKLLYKNFLNDDEILKIVTEKSGKQFYFAHSTFIDFIHKYGIQKIIEQKILFDINGDYHTPADDQHEEK